MKNTAPVKSNIPEQIVAAIGNSIKGLSRKLKLEIYKI